ncbi:uncharacterized protein LOC129220298 isoform X2 [Uloborus diversus]|uniref:uncharacterized protein LOC129220298 isoform X2 n=1 Tax=Uloborus diversus TaxID=327109 RepID=UPI0024098AFD|nr:uncharacterized protein LOC129220298 isoform X2 [Uloborus diversus]
MPSSAEPDSQNYRQKYRNLKRKLKVLIYENECFQEELKKAQRKLLKVSRDKSFLLDRLLRYENVDSSSSDSEATVSSDSDTQFRAELLTLKKKRAPVNIENQDTAPTTSTINNTSYTEGHLVKTQIKQTVDVKKKKPRKTCPAKPVVMPQHQLSLVPGPSADKEIIGCSSIPQAPSNVIIEAIPVNHGDGHMTSEEIERHLEAKHSLRDLIPEKTPLTVPVELFSNEPSVMECEIMDGQVSDISPNNVVENVGIMIDIHE